jgi:hypothetical protein
MEFNPVRNLYAGQSLIPGNLWSFCVDFPVEMEQIPTCHRETEGRAEMPPNRRRMTACAEVIPRAWVAYAGTDPSARPSFSCLNVALLLHYRGKS